jgi:hypothetical protein
MQIQKQNYPSQAHRCQTGAEYLDVEVVTARVDYIDKLFQEFLHRIKVKQLMVPLTADGISLALIDIHSENKILAQEYVEITSGEIRVVLNVKEIDDIAIARATAYVAEAIECSLGNDIRCEFSEPYTPNLAEFSWLLIKH